ncbi:type II toxin-antitoxin system RelE family toxin [Enterococcus avium]
MRHEVVFTDLSKRDFDKLDNSQRVQILKSLAKIEDQGMEAGQRLHGKLSDCRKLKHRRLGLRVIFKESDAGVEIIEIIVVGKREDSEAYKLAEKRLGR